MKIISVISVLLLFVFVCSINNAFSQMKKKGVTNQRISKEKPDKPFHKNTKLKISDSKRDASNEKKQISNEEKILTEKINSARKSGNQNEMDKLQNELHKIYGVVSKKGEQIGTFSKPDKNISDGGSVFNERIYFGANVRAITTVTEQRGPNAGRIWVVFTRDDANYAYIEWYYSDDGITWTYYTNSFSTFLINMADGIDAEIIENSSGNKYMYTVFEAQARISTKRVCVLATLRLTGEIEGSFQILEWPGYNFFDESTNYFNPRITSDNAHWDANTIVYIAVCQDTMSFWGDFGEKVANITSAFTSFPTVNYKPGYFLPLKTLGSADKPNCDIAWFNGTNYLFEGAIMFVESGVSPLSNISLYEIQDFQYLSTPTYRGTLDPDGINKSSAYISSKGLYHNLMIVNRNEYSPTDSDIQYFLTTDDGETWSDGFVSYTYDDDIRPDIAGMRNVPGYFNCAYAENDNDFDDVIFCTSRNNIWGDLVGPMNDEEASFIAQPRPGIKLNGLDSSLVVWSQAPGHHVWYSCLEPNLVLTAYIEGYYDPSTYLMVRPDTITVSMREFDSPNEIIESHRVEISNEGIAQIGFDAIDDTENFYLVVNSRNTIETWSIPFIETGENVILHYNFRDELSSVFGENEKLVGRGPIEPYAYAMYSGDVNQDGTVDATDMALIDNDASNFVTGYVSSDLTGDDFVDASDAAVADNNASNFVSVIRP